MKKSFNEKITMIIKGWLGSVLIAVLIATSFKSAIADWNVVPTGSMKPTIVEGDRIFVNKIAYDLKIPYTTWHVAQWNQPERGDIVVFYSPQDGTRLVKRVIGIPGDTVEMVNNRLYINDAPLEYEKPNTTNESLFTDPHSAVFNEDLSGRRHPIMIDPYSRSFGSFDPVTVPEGKFFMMGDNRDNSADSRFFGFVSRDHIVGKATGVVMSLDPENYYLPRWERFFSRLP